jgi:molybdenum cofactor cytidylyltransferase
MSLAFSLFARRDNYTLEMFYNQNMSLLLARALRASNAVSVAFIGAGGKTTAMFQLARELSAKTPVIVTASSHLGAWQIPQADKHLVIDSITSFEKLSEELHGVTLITGPLEDDRTEPVDSDILNWLSQFCKANSLPLLIEADGSRGKPLKAWANHEPPIPAFVDQVVQVVGLSGLGEAFNNENIHRTESFATISWLRIGELITPEVLVRVLIHPAGGLKNIPASARKTVLLNQADTSELQSIGHGMAHALLANYDSVVVASLINKEIYAVHESVAGVILAAGESKRYGTPKQLLNWKGKSFVHAVVEKALEAGLSPVLVITGAHGEQVEAAVGDLNVKIVHNNDWKNGQSSSIKAGVRTLLPPPPSGHLPQIRKTNSSTEDNVSIGFGGGRVGVGATIFLLVDQPQVTTSILRALVEKHAEGLDPIVAPMVIDQRANPVLFDRDTFQDLLQLEGDVGGRAVFHKYRVEYLPWHDDRLLLDVDTPEQYQRLISDDTL